MGSLYRRKKNGKELPTWWIKYHSNGRCIRESTRTTKETKAKAVLREREGRVAQGLPVFPRLDRILYDELATDLRGHYATTGKRGMQEVDDRLGHLDRFFKGRRAASIAPSVITEYVAKRQAEKTHIYAQAEPGKEKREQRRTSNRTINIELAMLRKMLRLAYENGKLLRVPPVRTLKEAAPRDGFFELDQYHAVRRRLPADLQVVVTIAHTFGWRIRSEVLPLQKRHLDLKAGTLRLDPGTTKNGEGRVVYMTPELKMLMAQQHERVEQLGREKGRIIPWLFPHLTGKHVGKPRTCFRKTWETACRKAGVPGRLLHDFRRTAVRNMERAGVPRSVAMKLTGHKTENVYRRYAIVSDTDLQEASHRLAGTHPGTPAKIAVDATRPSVQNLNA